MTKTAETPELFDAETASLKAEQEARAAQPLPWEEDQQEPEEQLAEALTEPEQGPPTMPEHPDAVASPAYPPATTRKTLSLAERLCVIDFLRGLPGPIHGRTKAEIARDVSQRTGVQIESGSLWYICEQLPLLKLEAKLNVLPEEPSVEQRLSMLAAAYDPHCEELASMRASVASLMTRLEDVEVRLERAQANGYLGPK